MRGFLLFLCTTACFANPIDHTVISGDVKLCIPAKNTLHVKTSHQAVIHWKDFSIDPRETTRFMQPSKDSIVINKVVGDSLSTIMGKLEANGQLMLINLSGILISEGARIETGQFTASTLDFENRDDEILFKGTSNGRIINFGTIKAWDGDVTLISRTIHNHGSIEANEGHVHLGVGQEILLKPSGDERIYIRAQEFEEEIGILNTGSISAIQAELKADGNPYAFAIKHEGTIDALSTVEKSGRVLLVAEEGTNLISGTITAEGGYIALLGEKVGLIDHAEVDASATEGGGKILIGGSYKGYDPKIYNSEFTTVLENTILKANALEYGDGGTVILWSNGYTRSLGTIEVQGGPKGGDLGFIDISGTKGCRIENSKPQL